MAGSEYRAGPSSRFSHGAPARGFKKLTLEREEIAEMDYRPSKAEGTYRLLDVNAWSRLLLEGSVWLKRRAAT